MLERTEPPSVENLSEARRAVEAMLLVANDPTPVQLLAQLVELPVDVVQSMCRELSGEYEAEHRGFQLVEVAGGWRYQTHPDTHAYVERFALEGIPNRLSSAALETLAIVAYKQPISRAQIGAIRGVNVDGVLRTLVQRGYVDEKGRDVGPGQATLFGTSSFFLEQLGLMSLDDLPPLGDFVPSVEVLEALENTLRVDQEPEIVIVDDAPGVDQGTGDQASAGINGASPAVTNGVATNGVETNGGTSNGAVTDGSPATTNGSTASGPTVASEEPSGDDQSAAAESTEHGGPANDQPVDGEPQASREPVGVELEAVDGDAETGGQPIFEIMGDPAGHVIPVAADLARVSTAADEADEVEAGPIGDADDRPATPNDQVEAVDGPPETVELPEMANDDDTVELPETANDDEAVELVETVELADRGDDRSEPADDETADLAELAETADLAELAELAETADDDGRGLAEPERQPARNALAGPEPGSQPEPSDRARTGELATDELEVTADPEVDTTDGLTATGAAGADDARFPGAGSREPTDDPERLDPGEDEAADLGRWASSATEGTGGQPGPSSAWPETVIDGLRNEAESGDA